MTTSALVVAAGKGTRAGEGPPKQYRVLCGVTVIDWSLAALKAAMVNDVVVVVAPEHMREAAALEDRHPWVRVVQGGDTRTASVRAGVQLIDGAENILVHDAARPGLTPTMVRSLLVALERGAVAVAPALPVADTLLRADPEGRVLGAVDRAGVMRVQTPQAFRASVLKSAYASAPAQASFTDDLAVAMAAGHTAQLVEGDPMLMKLTHAEDFALMERMLAGPALICVGHGFDAHRFGPGEHVTLCGVRIAHELGLVGHSDADAGWHALVDAILGALGQGDIGAHFPPSDAQWKGADSEAFLRHARMLAQSSGARINHVDVTLICERPRVGPHREAMRRRTAEVLGLPIDQVSIKATTTERMGFTGRGEGLAAQATATLDRLSQR